MNKKEILTIPNALSFYRLAMFPLILYFILSGRESLFALFLVINLVTDVADGIIARRLNMVTEFGAKLDSIADDFTYLLAFLGIVVFKLDNLLPHIHSFVLWFVLMVLMIIFSLIKFGRLTSFHLYSFKIGGYIQAFFFIILFTIGFITPLYYFMVIWGILAAIEHLIIQFILSELRSNAKGLYWVIKEQKA
ncbi:MAG: CDP-alcohol phosphatidyltransferase family protein [Bacteroidales bacterium]|jgi:CDP-diacylglycerol--glycerol-3-phosphate 3-phosphatidyltransferase|nr:CDP-alcohol phosphatidyltransferase family protein [Bacteroidales bacterium]NLM93510.1 CDP-alcohol phosphatidyltransferase family protein [Bacteroidales bacterium]